MKRSFPVLVFALALLAPATCAYAGSSVYGIPWNADGLNNTPIGRSYNRMADYRFQATHSGIVWGLRLYLIFAKISSNCTYSGYYAGGTGGKILVQLQGDDRTSNHFPNGKALTSFLINNPLACNPGKISCTNSQRLYGFKSPVSLAAGTIYHLVFSNVDPNKSCNWTSIDSLNEAQDTSNIQPAVSDLNFSELTKDSYTGGWQISNNTTPIMDLNYTDGSHFGQGFIYVNPGYGVYGLHQVRELFISRRSATFTRVYIRAAKTGLPSALQVRVWNNGGQIASGTVSSFNSKGWGQASLSSSVSLVAGRAYSIRLLNPDGNSSESYTVQPMQAGTVYGFGVPNEFAEGYFQYSADGGSAWYNYPSNRKDFDLQVYLAP